MRNRIVNEYKILLINRIISEYKILLINRIISEYKILMITVHYFESASCILLCSGDILEIGTSVVTSVYCSLFYFVDEYRGGADLMISKVWG